MAHRAGVGIAQKLTVLFGHQIGIGLQGGLNTLAEVLQGGDIVFKGDGCVGDIGRVDG